MCDRLWKNYCFALEVARNQQVPAEKTAADILHNAIIVLVTIMVPALCNLTAFRLLSKALKLYV
jgi:hypothetical protein